MDLRQLTAFLAVVEHGSFSAAAKSLHTVQSNVSTHVGRLERELGTTLIDRATGFLTPAGEIVVSRTRRIRHELDAIDLDVAALHDEVSGTVRLGIIGTTARWLVPKLFVALADAHPRVNLVVIDATTTSLVPQLENGDLDLAILNMPVHYPDIHIDCIFEEEHVLIIPKQHLLHDRFTQNDTVHLRDVEGIPLLLEPQGTGFRDHLDEQAAEYGFTLSAQVEVDGVRLLATLAFESFGIAILPASAMSKQQSKDWSVRRLEGLSHRTVGLARRRKGLLSAPARAVEGTIHDVTIDSADDILGVFPKI